MSEPDEKPRKASRSFLLGSIALLIGVASLATWALWPRDATQVSDSKVIEDFRKTSTTTPKITPREDPPAAATPPPGVYRYSATGKTSSKFGPLPEKTNPLPDTVTATVIEPDGEGCFTFTLNLFTEHTEDTTFCAKPDTLEMTHYAKKQTVGTLTATASVACDPGTFIATDAPVHDLKCVMTLEGGPFKTQADFTGKAEVGAPTSLQVAGKDVTTTPVTVTFDFTGKVTGTWTEQTWFDERHLPVRIKRSLTMNGPASFDEQFDLHLASTTPST